MARRRAPKCIELGGTTASDQHSNFAHVLNATAPPTTTLSFSRYFFTMTDVHPGPSFHARHHSASSISMTNSPTISSSSSVGSSRSLKALDLHSTSQLDIPSALASLRVHVLSYLSDLEARLAQLDHTSQSGATATRSSSPPPSVNPFPPELKATKSAPAISHPSLLAESVPVVTGNVRLAPSGGADEPTSSGTSTNPIPVDPVALSKLDDADLDDLGLNGEDIAEFLAQAFDLLSTIRTEVCSYLPDTVDLNNYFVDFPFPIPHSETMHAKREAFKHRLSELGTNLQLHVPSRQGISDRFEQMSTDAQAALRSKWSDLTPDGGFAFAGSGAANSAISYVPRLKEHLTSLQEHMQDLPFRVPPAFAHLQIGGDPAAVHAVPKTVTDLLADLLQEDTEEAIQADMEKEKAVVESTHAEVARALEKSESGRRLIEYEDLPRKWRNNQHVRYGYR